MELEDLQKTGKINRTWGYEIVWASNDKYCGKILVFEEVGAKTALTVHKEKCKSWFVNSGRLKISYVNTANGETQSQEVSEGMTFEAGPMAPHQVECLTENTVVFEVSTPDIIADTFRLTKDEYVPDDQASVQESDTQK